MQKKIQSKILYKGSIFTLTDDTIEIENGMIVVIRDIIHHHGGCAILAQIEDKVLLISQYRYAVRENTI